MNKQAIEERTKLVESIISGFNSLTNQAVVVIQDQQQADQLFSKIKEMLYQQKEKAFPHLPIGYRTAIAKRTTNMPPEQALPILTFALYDAITIYNKDHFNRKENRVKYEQLMKVWTRANATTDMRILEDVLVSLYHVSKALDYFSPPGQYFDKRNNRYGYWMK